MTPGMLIQTGIDWVDLPDARLGYQPVWQPDQQALFDQLHDSLAWRQDSITLFGRRVRQPRLSAWYGDPDAGYRYSGLQLQPLPWTPELAELRQRLQDRLGQPFNSVLANLYRDGADSMGWHADDEPELGRQPVIASLSLGGTRRFVLRRRKPPRQPREWLLPGGSLLVMAGDTQRCWQHALPKTRKPVAARINLTFRTVMSRD